MSAAAAFLLAASVLPSQLVTVTDLTVKPVDGGGGAAAANTALFVAAPDGLELPAFTAALDDGTALTVTALRGSHEVAVVSLAPVLPLAQGQTVQVRLEGEGASRVVAVQAGAPVIEAAPPAPADAELEPIDPCFPEERAIAVTPPAGAVALVVVPVRDGVEGAGHAVLVDGSGAAVAIYDQVVGNDNPDYEVIAVDAAGQESEPALLGAPIVPEGGGDDLVGLVGCNAGGVVGGAPALFVILGVLAVRRRRR